MINGIGSYNNPLTGNNTLIAAYGNDMVNVATGLGYRVNLDSDYQVNFASLLNSLFFQNYIDTPRTFNGTTWSRTHVGKLPLSRYIYPWDNRMYLGYLKIKNTEYASRIWLSDLPKNDILHWGYEDGDDLQMFAGSPVIKSNLAYFVTNGIKRGDSIFILSGTNAGEYIVQSIDHEKQITLTESLVASESGVSFWVGSNYIDFDRDDGDFITWITENSNQLAVLKRDSFHLYDRQSRRKVTDALGTTSGRSVINMEGVTVYFHGSSALETGFYACDGRESILISSAVTRHIQGIDQSMYNQVIAWREGTLYRAYIGPIVNSNYDLSIPQAIFTYDFESNAGSIDPISHTIEAATQFREANNRFAFFGTGDAKVMKTPSGNSFDGENISFDVENWPVYPEGTDMMNEFTRIQVISENAKGTRVLYKLHLSPFESSEDWIPLGQITGEKTEFELDLSHNMASGISLYFTGIGDKEVTEVIKKYTVFYKPLSTVIQ